MDKANVNTRNRKADFWGAGGFLERWLGSCPNSPLGRLCLAGGCSGVFFEDHPAYGDEMSDYQGRQGVDTPSGPISLALPPETITLMASDGRWVMKITKDGVESNPEVSIDDGAKAIFEALKPYLQSMKQ